MVVSKEQQQVWQLIYQKETKQYKLELWNVACKLLNRTAIFEFYMEQKYT